MELLKRIAFALRHDIEPDYYVFDFDVQSFVRYTYYDEAHAASLADIQRRPSIFVKVDK